MATASDNRAFSAAHFSLELDGKKEMGTFRSIEGGDLKTDVMTYQNGSGYDRWRQLGKPKFGDIKAQIGMSMSEEFFAWITNFITTGVLPDRRNGAITAHDFYYKERARREFTQAMIKEVTIPKLDATDKNPAYMGITLSVEGITFKPGTGAALGAVPAPEAQKLWTSANFRFRLDGFTEASKHVSKIDSFTIKQNIIEYHAGDVRAPTKHPSSVEYPQISFYVPESHAQPFYEHVTKRAINGEVPGRLTGEIVTMDQELKDLFTLQFFGADIVGVTPDKSDASAEEIKQVKIDIYTESMKFKYNKVSAKSGKQNENLA